MFWLTGIYKWAADKAVLLFIIVAGCVMIYLGVSIAYAKIGELATAKQNIETIRLNNIQLQQDVVNLKTSQQATADALKNLNASVAAIDKAATQRAVDTNKKIQEINKDPTLTEKQKDQATSRLYVKSLRTTFCAYQPNSCQQAQEAKP